MQKQETTPTTCKKSEELKKLLTGLNAIKELFDGSEFSTDGFTFQALKELADEKIAVLRSRLNECIFLVGELRDYFYIKEI